MRLVVTSFGGAGRAALVTAVLLAVVGYGGVYPRTFWPVLLLASLALVLALFGPLANERLWRAQLTAFALALAAAVYVALQSWPLPLGVGHAIWPTAAELLDTGRAALSAEPGTTRHAIPALVLPFIVFMATLTLFPDDGRALLLWRALAGFGAAAAAVSVMQFVLFPDTLLLGPKQHYLDSLTGPFVNRNTAATFFGLAAVLTAGCLLQSWQTLRARRDARPFGEHAEHRTADRGPHRRLALWSLALVVILVALALTRSRAGIAASYAALALFLCGALFGFLRDRRSPAVAAIWVSAGAVGLVALFWLISGRALLRLETQGLSDSRWCAYEYTWAAIRDHPLLGTGFGTFPAVFPSYRLGACFPYGEWTKAHSVYLEAYLGLGLPFIAMLLAVVIVLLRAYARGYRERRRARFAPVGGLAMLVLVLLHSAVDFSIQIPGVTVFFAAGSAAAVAISLGRYRRPT